MKPLSSPHRSRGPAVRILGMGRGPISNSTLNALMTWRLTYVFLRFFWPFLRLGLTIDSI